MKKIIIMIFCALFLIGQFAVVNAEPQKSGAAQPSSATGQKSAAQPGKKDGATVSDDCECSKVFLPFGEGGGRSSADCQSAAGKMAENNKLLEDIATKIAENTQKQAEDNADDYIDNLMDCISTLNSYILGGLDLGNLSWDAVKKALINSACKYAKQKTGELWQKGLEKLQVQIGDKTFDLANLELLGVNITSTTIQGGKKGQLPITISKMPKLNNAAWYLFKNSGTINGLASGSFGGTGGISGNQYIDDFISIGIEELLKSQP